MNALIGLPVRPEAEDARTAPPERLRAIGEAIPTPTHPPISAAHRALRDHVTEALAHHQDALQALSDGGLGYPGGQQLGFALEAWSRTHDHIANFEYETAERAPTAHERPILEERIALLDRQVQHISRQLVAASATHRTEMVDVVNARLADLEQQRAVQAELEAQIPAGVRDAYAAARARVVELEEPARTAARRLQELPGAPQDAGDVKGWARERAELADEAAAWEDALGTARAALETAHQAYRDAFDAAWGRAWTRAQQDYHAAQTQGDQIRQDAEREAQQVIAVAVERQNRIWRLKP